jgi:hypothetical protein
LVVYFKRGVIYGKTEKVGVVLGGKYFKQFGLARVNREG